MGEPGPPERRAATTWTVFYNGFGSSASLLGSASVELIFDNADGKIGGAYASYSEISLRRQVGRDGTSAYSINGTRCRRKDITGLFLRRPRPRLAQATPSSSRA